MTRMVTMIFATAIAAMVLTGCVEVRSVSYEGATCSVDKDESPHYTCDQARLTLVCIETYTLGEKKQPIPLCRRPCQARPDCGNGDYCCAGRIVGKNFGASKACVPREECQMDPAALLEPAPGTSNDGGNRDVAATETRTMSEAGVDAMSTEADSSTIDSNSDI